MVLSLRPRPPVAVALSAVSAWYSKMDFGHLKRAMIDGGVQTAVVMLLVAASVVMGGFLTRAQIPQDFARWILDMTTNQRVILAILNVFFLVIGFFLHSAAAIILVVPIVIPLIQAAGIDPIHFGLLYSELGAGPADPTCGQCFDHFMCGCSCKYLGCIENQYLFHRSLICSFDVVYLCTGSTDVSS